MFFYFYNTILIKSFDTDILNFHNIEHSTELKLVPIDKYQSIFTNLVKQNGKKGYYFRNCRKKSWNPF